MIRQTYTYGILPVKEETFEDIKERLKTLGKDYWYEYTDSHYLDEEPTKLIFGPVALMKEKFAKTC